MASLPREDVLLEIKSKTSLKQGDIGPASTGNDCFGTVSKLSTNRTSLRMSGAID